MSNVLISVATEFDKKGFTQADKGLSVLTKKVIKFTSTLALAHKAQQAMFAAMADEKATKILAQNLRNLGMAFAVAPAEQFIAAMQKQTGVLDDELRPAYAQLARVTGDMQKTQKLLYVAWNTASGSGADFLQVVDALSQAYVGNTKGLKSLNLGLTQAELKSASFEEIVALLNKQFGGAGAASLETYAGKMSLLAAAGSSASESIGMGLLSAIETAAGSPSTQKLVDDIENLAQTLGYAISMFGVGTRAILIWANAFRNPKKALQDFNELLDKTGQIQKKYNERNMKVWYPEGYQTAEMKKAAAAAAARAKEILAINKKITSEKKAQIAVDKANALIAKAKEQFDLEGIQLAAALTNQTLTIEERKRLEVKQAIWDLEQALAQNDQARIASATALLEKLLNQFKVLQDQLMTLNEMYKVLAELGVNRQLIDLLNLEDAINLMNQMAILGQLTLPKNFPAPTATMVTKQEAAAALTSALSPESMAWTQHELAITANRASFLNQPPMATSTQPPVVVTITDNAQKVVDVVVEGLQQLDASGISTKVIRNTGGLNW